MSDIDKKIGLRIKSRRKMLGLSQTEIADAVKVSFQQIQKYENGSNRVSASRLLEIGTVLSVEPTYFFQDVLEEQSTPSRGVMSIGAIATDPKLLEVASHYHALSDDKKETVLALLRSLNDSPQVLEVNSARF